MEEEMTDQNTTLDIEKQDEGQREGTEDVRERQSYIPRADIYETEDAIVVLADVPGADESTIDIRLEKNILSLSARIDPEYHEAYRLSHSEYGTGDYERRFVLSNQVDREGIEAAVKNGVLRLQLPKSKQAQTRKITVKAG
jgi:HSP20 family molecular chaperone IbpA